MDNCSPEMKKEPEAKTEHPTAEPTIEAAKETVSVQKAAAEAEIQLAYRQMKANRSARWFMSCSNADPTARPRDAKDAVHLMQMDFDNVLAVLHKESQKGAQRKRIKIWAGRINVALLIILAICMHGKALLVFNAIAMPIRFLITSLTTSVQQKAAALAVARFDDVRAVGPLAEALELSDPHIGRIVTRALIRLLPRLQASDGALLSSAQRSCLNRALRGKNADLTLAILKAWEQVGDAEAIPDVETLAEGRGRGGRSPIIEAAAQECLPFLRQSAERRHIGAQLLRPVEDSPKPSDNLLRPALSHVSTDPPEQLLRPTNAD